MLSKAFVCLFTATLLATSAFCAPALEYYGADGNLVSVSGISAGAFMAVQVHVAYSKSVMGVGVVAGGPYWCARANIMYALNSCMSTGNIPVDTLIDGTQFALNTLTIDHYSNMANDKIYIFAGTQDNTVIPEVGLAAEEYYRYYISNNANFKTEYSIPAEHAMITDNWGNMCGTLAAPYINNCGYSVAFEMLDHIYGGLTRPAPGTVQAGDFLTFDQNEFFSFNNADKESVDDTGFIYVPYGCRGDASHCRVHIALHGCLMQYDGIGEDYVKHGGYNEVAEVNDIIVIYPQTIARSLSGNPNACWDWWGYTTVSYACNLAPQMDFMKQIIDRVTA